MCSRGVLVHCPSRLGAAVSVEAVELPCGDRVFTEWALERAKAVHHFDGVMSHSFNSSPSYQYVSELKLPLPRITCEMAICRQTKEVYPPSDKPTLARAVSAPGCPKSA